VYMLTSSLSLQTHLSALLPLYPTISKMSCMTNYDLGLRLLSYRIDSTSAKLV
jgi:hypothetical protein